MDTENLRASGNWIVKQFLPSTRKISLLKRFLCIILGISRLSISWWEATKSTIDKKNTYVFLTDEAIPPSMWNAFQYVPQFNFKKTCIAGSVNTAAGFLSGLELKVTYRIRLKNREDIQLTHLRWQRPPPMSLMKTKQFFLTQADNENETEDQTLARKEQSRKTAAEWMENRSGEEPSSLRTSIREFRKLDGNNT